MPRPRKLSVVSARIAVPASRVAATMSGERELGSKWRSMTRQREAPRHCAASTNSCSRKDNTAPRAKRAALVHSNATRIMMMLSNPHPLLDRRQLFGEHPHALKSHRILSDEAGVDHRYMFGLAPVVINEAGGLAL